jgi:hypothetical protein
MFNFKRANENSGLLSFDWQSILEQLQKCDPNDGNFYIITLNKGTPDEYRTRFMTFQETKELVIMALEKKRLRIPLTL